MKTLNKEHVAVMQRCGTNESQITTLIPLRFIKATYINE